MAHNPARTLRGTTAVVGIGQTDYYKRSGSPDPEFKLAIKAILAACEDAGISPTEIDGFSSYSNDRSEASRMAAALGINELRLAVMQWGGGGAVLRALSPTQQQRSQRARPSVSWCSAPSLKVSSGDSGRAHAGRRSAAPLLTRCPTG